MTKGASSSAKHPSKVSFTKAGSLKRFQGGLKGASRGWRGLQRWRGLEGSLKRTWRGLEGDFKGAWRELDLEGGLKGGWRGLEAFSAEGGFEGVWRGLQGLLLIYPVFKVLRNGLLRYKLFTHVQTCNVTREQTEWTASVHTLHTSKPVM